MSLTTYPLPISNMNINDLCQQYINILYHNIRILRTSEKLNIDISETYGEILYESMGKLIDEISFSEEDVFFDLGSGLGKIVIQVFLRSLVRESCGIEIIPDLYQKSILAAQRVKDDLPDFHNGERKISFIKGSFLDVSLARASVMLIGSPCFRQQILFPLGKIIDTMPGIHTVLTLRPLFSLTRLSLRKVVRVECSWDTALCYIYK